MGLMDSEEARLLRDSVANRVRSGGQLGIDEMRDITSDALTSKSILPWQISNT